MQRIGKFVREAVAADGFLAKVAIFLIAASFALVFVSEIIYGLKYHVTVQNDSPDPLEDVVAVFAAESQNPRGVALGKIEPGQILSKTEDSAKGDFVLEYVFRGQRNEIGVDHLRTGYDYRFVVNYFGRGKFGGYPE